MKVKFNWKGTDDKFYGLKKLQFHSQRADDTQMKERMGYYLFRSMGVPAPRSVHARLLINGEFNGLFALTEQIDGRFTRLNFEDGENNLYKEIWPVDQFGETYGEQDYKDHLKTNEDENPSVALMMSFAEEISSADVTDMPELINNWMDIDKITSYIVVDRTIKNDDGVFHWYCSDGWCSSHNYYWYEDVEQNKIHLIPWDLDNSFENIIEVENPWTQVVDPLGQITANCEPFNAGPLMQRSASCDKLTSGWASFTEELNQKKSQLINGPMTAINTNRLIDKWSTQIREATIEARNLHDDAVSLERWEEQVNELKLKLEYARNN
ncbi:hypothetical protein FB2170_08744 [Maribacter sp. HTCC2170]|nr:hypothetical protein FB2170_08744 [Maribacter sp. HTCC2170]